MNRATPGVLALALIASATLTTTAMANSAASGTTVPTSGEPAASTGTAEPFADYVGSQRCAGCHADVATRWRCRNHAGAYHWLRASVLNTCVRC